VIFVGTGRTVRICTGRTTTFLRHKNRGKLGHSFSRQPLKNFLKEDGRTEGKVQLPIVAQISRCQLSANPYNCTDCGMVFKTDLCGTIFFVL
jgi:hypothetical protein